MFLDDIVGLNDDRMSPILSVIINFPSFFVNFTFKFPYCCHICVYLSSTFFLSFSVVQVHAFVFNSFLEGVCDLISSFSMSLLSFSFACCFLFEVRTVSTSLSLFFSLLMSW